MQHVWSTIAQSKQPWLVLYAPVLSVLVASTSAYFAWRSSRSALLSEENSKEANNLAAERDHRERAPRFLLIDDNYHAGTSISTLRLRQISGPWLARVEFRVNELHEYSSPRSQEYHTGKVRLEGKWTIGGNLGEMGLNTEVVLKVLIESQKKEEFALILDCTSYDGERWMARAEIAE